MIEDIRRVLEGVRTQGDGFTAKCPAHEDARSSLKVDPKPGDPDGWPLMKCYTGCSFESIREALLRKGVKPPEKRREEPPQPARLRETRFKVCDPDGNLLATKVRLDPGKRIHWETPDGGRSLRDTGLRTEDMLYRVEFLRENPDASVVICEGEKAAQALADLGVKCALGTVGGAEAGLSRKAVEPLRGREVFLWPDNDDPGRKHMGKIKAALVGVARGLYTIRWDEAPPKGDAADWTPGKRLSDFAALASEATRQPAPEWSRPFSAAINELLADIDRRINGEPSGAVPSGIEVVDAEIRGGFLPGEVYLWGAPTGGGKTTIMQSIAINVARGYADRGIAPRRVLMVSPEMTLVEIARRAVVSAVGRSMEVWRNEEAAQPFIRAAAGLVNLPITLCDKVDITMPEVVSEAVRLAGEPEGLGLVIIDYAQQVVDDSDPRARYLQVGDVAEKAVVIAKTLRLPVLVASQVNKTIPDKKGSKPTYTFRESAKLEHKASVVLIFDRREDFDPDSDAMIEEDDRVDAKVMCLKNRLGPQFRRVPVTWRKATFTVTGEPWQDAVEAREPELVVAGSPEPELPPDRGSFFGPEQE